MVAAQADAAIIATPTITHADLGCRLMELGLDVLVGRSRAVSTEPVVEGAAEFPTVSVARRAAT